MLSSKCVRCGGRAVFTLLFADSVKKGGKEKGDAPVPMVWECEGCQFMTPLVLVKNGTC